MYPMVIAKKIIKLPVFLIKSIWMISLFNYMNEMTSIYGYSHKNNSKQGQTHK